MKINSRYAVRHKISVEKNMYHDVLRPVGTVYTVKYAKTLFSENNLSNKRNTANSQPYYLIYL